MQTNIIIASCGKFAASGGVGTGGRFREVLVLLAKLAEREGVEPPEPCGSTVFKTAAFGHSAIPPLCLHRTAILLVFEVRVNVF